MKLRAFCDVLEKLAPTRHAAKWDNVGLLLEPSEVVVERVLLTNDLTSKVMKEAIDYKANIIVSYHPPLFASFKRISQDKWKDRIVTECLRHNIAIYSPHTAHDAWSEGVNAWLIEGIIGSQPHFPISPTMDTREMFEISGTINETFDKKAFRKLFNKTKVSDDNILSGIVTKGNLPKLTEKFLPDIIDFKLVCLGPTPIIGSGMGRKGNFVSPKQLSEVVEITKNHLKLPNLRLVTGVNTSTDAEISSVAVCAGSGASVLANAGNVDLWITGEMGHHEALDAQENNTSVILAEHSNTERGFLSCFIQKIQENDIVRKKNIEFMVSNEDKDPIQIV